MAWQDTAFPVPVHAAAIMGESMDENSAEITVMDKRRRIDSSRNIPLFLSGRQ
jgi:hypothetical protein